MKFTLSWLRDHLDFDADLEKVTETLTAVGLEVEDITDHAKLYDKFVVGHVVAARQHPNADRLRLCTVDIGTGENPEVVCGAPNAREGIKICYAQVGAVIPASGDALKPAKIRGVESKGMLCSVRELELGDDHDGILELPEDAPIGAEFAGYMNLDDPVIEIAITPNRADCLGVRGIARDLAAAGLGTLKPDPWSEAVRGPLAETGASKIGVTVEADSGCAVFYGRTISGVKNGESPQWLKDRLTAVGLRPINALVDITNYVSFDRARPLHAFDADKLKGDIVVRKAKADERLVPVVGDDDILMTGGECLITDGETVTALGGIMGGLHSGSDLETQTVFYESAWFDPVKVATIGRQHNILSDARYRFERGVDPENALDGVNMAARMTVEICGGTISEVVSSGQTPDWQRSYQLRTNRCATLGGLDVPVEVQRTTLEKLGFTVSGEGDVLDVAVPSWRGDVGGEADLVEEILRIQSLDAIPEVPLPRLSEVARTSLTPIQKRVRTSRRLLASRGFSESVSFSFMDEATAKHFGWHDERTRLLHPISSDLSVMRPSILPNLLQAAGRNANRGYGDVALFEVGPAYPDAEGKNQLRVAAGIRVGQTALDHWSGTKRPVDAFDVKADVLTLMTEIGAPADKLQTTEDAPDWYHPGRSGVLRLGPKHMAYFGELHPRVLKALDLQGPAMAFEVFLDLIPLPRKKGTGKGRLDMSQFQHVDRDFAFIVKEDVAAEDVVKAARGADKALITDVSIFDVYTGQGVKPGEKSLAIRVRLQPKEATLTDSDIEAVSQKIAAMVAKGTGGTLRG